MASPSAVRSAPAQNALPAPVTISACTSGFGFRGVDRRAQRRRDLGGDRVAAVGVVDGDEGDVVVDLDQYRIGHGLSLVTGHSRER